MKSLIIQYNKSTSHQRKSHIKKKQSTRSISGELLTIRITEPSRTSAEYGRLHRNQH